jgi:hypothetical protein
LVIVVVLSAVGSWAAAEPGAPSSIVTGLLTHKNPFEPAGAPPRPDVRGLPPDAAGLASAAATAYAEEGLTTAHVDDIYWWTGFSAPGMNSWVKVLAVYDGDLIAGGRFTLAGPTWANYIARWDGAAWHPLGSGVQDAESGPAVEALAIYRGDLIAAGTFHRAGNDPYANNVARWNGVAWSRVGTGLVGDYETVHDLVIYDGALVAGGDFLRAGSATMNRIARWDGNLWRALGSGMDEAVYALAVFNGDLIAGGRFTMAGGAEANYVARWDGTSWSSLGSGVNSTVSALTVHGGELIVGGSFSEAGGLPAAHVARWNGESWGTMGLGFEGWLEELGSYGGELIAGGRFTAADGAEANNIARWDGLRWQPLGEGTGRGATPGFPGSGDVLALVEDEEALVVGGAFATAGPEAAWFVATWDGEAWHPFCEGWGVTGPSSHPTISRFGVFDGALIAAGLFDHAGCIPAANIARWDGTRWHAMGSGLEFGPLYLGPYGDLIVYDGRLVVAGAFERAGGVEVNGIAAWDGEAWSALGGGVNERALALAIYDGALVVGGDFTEVGDGVPARGLATWNGTDWSAFGSGIGGSFQTVSDLLVRGDQLFVGGAFDSIGGIYSPAIASWDGESWKSLGGGMLGQVVALAVYDGDLVAAGSFWEAGGVAAENIARWDGTGWSALGDGTSGVVHALEVFGGELVAGGGFILAGGEIVDNIARWDGAAWRSLGSGVERYYYVFGLEAFEGNLYVGGDFPTAGRHLSLRVGRWDAPVTPVLLEAFTAERRGEAGVLRWRVGSATDHAGFHVHRGDEPGRERLTPSLLFGRREYEFIDEEAPPTAVNYWLEEVSLSGASSWLGPATLAASEAIAQEPSVEACPNPFSPGTRITYAVAPTGSVVLAVYDVNGRRVRTLVDEWRPAGAHVVFWDGRDASARPVSAGVYFVRLETSQEARTQKLVVSN